MIIRIKKQNRKEVMEFMADPENIDYWVDSELHHLVIEICGKEYIAKRGKEETLEKGLDMIHEAVKNHYGFVDLSTL